jgi:hypothetical protein
MTVGKSERPDGSGVAAQNRSNDGLDRAPAAVLDAGDWAKPKVGAAVASRVALFADPDRRP